MITLENISKSFQIQNTTVPVFSNICANFVKEKRYVITGPSGIGKSTLLSIVASFDDPTAGNVFFNGQNIHQYSQNEQTYFRTHHIGFLFQKAQLINELSVLENVALPAMIAGVPAAQAYECASGLLDKLQLLHKKDGRPLLLSGGEQQRVALARAVCNAPTFLLADEPTAFLDAKTAAHITDFIFNLAEKNGTSVIINSHDPRLFEYADQVFLLNDQALVVINK